MAKVQEFQEVPVIDISLLRSAPSQAQDTVREIARACQDVGFFYIKGHAVPQERVDQLEKLSHEFFSLPEEEKMKIPMSMGGKAWRGYFPVGGELTSGKPDMKEGLYFGTELPADHPMVQAGVPLHGANLFPDHPPQLKQTVLEYQQQMEVLGQTLLRGISMSLGLEPEFFEQKYMSNPVCLFRIFSYPPNRLAAEDGGELWGGECSVKCWTEQSITGKNFWAGDAVGEHTDYGILTILRQDDSGGLQVKNRNNQWIDAPPIPGTFVINIGDMLEVLTGGLFRSTPHRVKNKTGVHRLSFPFFMDPSWDAILTPVPLPPQWQAAAEKARRAEEEGTYRRWDGAELHTWKGTYGSYLLQKVSKVFPDLAQAQQVKDAATNGSTANCH